MNLCNLAWLHQVLFEERVLRKLHYLFLLVLGLVFLFPSHQIEYFLRQRVVIRLFLILLRPHALIRRPVLYLLDCVEVFPVRGGLRARQVLVAAAPFAHFFDIEDPCGAATAAGAATCDVGLLLRLSFFRLSDFKYKSVLYR